MKTCAFCGHRDASTYAPDEGRMLPACAHCLAEPPKPRRSAWDGPRAEYVAGPKARAA